MLVIHGLFQLKRTAIMTSLIWNLIPFLLIWERLCVNPIFSLYIRGKYIVMWFWILSINWRAIFYSEIDFFLLIFCLFFHCLNLNRSIDMMKFWALTSCSRCYKNDTYAAVVMKTIEIKFYIYLYWKID